MTGNVAEEVKSRLDIVDVISDYVELKKSGSTMKAICPFHAEKTPSFTVSPQRQIFHCFGCGAGGDMFAFVMKYENVSFREALGVLAKRAGVEIAAPGPLAGRSSTEVLRGVHDEATEFFSRALEASREARDFFSRRGINAESVRQFRLGFAPPKRDALYRHLKAKGYEDAVLQSAGVVRLSEKGTRYDMFRGRAIFPIADARGRVIAFGARILGGGGESQGPKYINSPETPVFKKSHTLYGLDVAKEHIRQKGFAILVEGYTDVIMLHQHGFRHAVAPLGTAITEGHLKQLRAYAGKLLLVFDGDEAGLNAARRTLGIVYENGMRAKVLLLPQGSDPDTFLRERGTDEFRKLYRTAVDIVDFYLGLGEDRVEMIRELIGIAARMKDAILRGQVVTEISQKTSIPSVYLVEEIQKRTKNEASPRSEHDRRRNLTAEETLLAICFLRPERGKGILARVDGGVFEDRVAREIFLRAREAGEFPPVDRVGEVYGDDEVSRITSLTVNAEFDDDHLETIIGDCLKKMRAQALRRSIEDMELKIKIAEASGDISLLQTLLSRKQEVLEEAMNEGIL